MPSNNKSDLFHTISVHDEISPCHLARQINYMFDHCKTKMLKPSSEQIPIISGKQGTQEINKSMKW